MSRATTGSHAPAWDLLRTLIERQLKLRAQRAWFSFAWPVVAPLILLVLYSFVFRGVFRVRIPRYNEFLFAGLLPWSYLAMSLGTAVQSITLEPELVRKSRFRYELLPISTTLGLALPFLVTLAGFVAFLGTQGELNFALLPLLIIPTASLLLFVSGVALVLALIDVYNRDLRQILGNLLTVWFFLVPIVYRHDMTPSALGILRSIDPMNLIVGQFRDVLFWRDIGNPAHFLLVAALSAGWFAAAMMIFRRFSRSLAKDL